MRRTRDTSPRCRPRSRCCVTGTCWPRRCAGRAPRRRWTWPPDDASILGETIPYWPPFPDVAAGLAELRAAGWRLALLTNCDRDLVAGALRRLPVPFEAVVTAEEAGAYKPEFAHFEVFRSAYEPEAWVHVAQSYFHDQVPAHRLGLPRVWINRLGHEPEDPSVIQRVQPGLHGLRAAVEAAYDEAAR
ncbi:hypothetical protein [Nonomuraea salmonea]|uniref:hypothetical protein n=1 Tax=Nonomuraea salmonea TaxID=46181 RepID=UPI0031ED797D